MAKLTSDRSTRLLMELIQEPGNDVCADCKSPAPRWASYNLGIFLCMHCASIHRKMGTHISKVKSINMDQWTKDQVDVSFNSFTARLHKLMTNHIPQSIRVTGNLNSNAMYNPSKVDPPVNLHDSERDSELEKFIRNKYQFKKLMNMRNNRDVPSSSNSRSRFLSSKPDSERNEEGRMDARELLTVSPPPRSSSASRPRPASPALTTKSPAPASVSPAPPTPSPSLPTPAPAPQAPLQMLAPSPQPPLQMLSPSPNPPLQMLAPSMGLAMQPQTNFTSGYMPSYSPSGYAGSMASSSPYQMPLTTQSAMPNSNPVWQDMAAIQSGPAMPSFQQLMPTGVSLAPQMTSNMVPMQGMPTGWAPSGGMMQGTPMGSMGPSMMASYPGVYPQATGMPGMQPMSMQNQPMYSVQQQQQQQQQQQMQQQQHMAMYGPGAQQQQQQIMQPAPVQGMNQMMWMQGGGYSAPNQWQG